MSIKIRVLHVREQNYNSIESFCKEINKDKEFELLVIVGWDEREECIKQVNSFKHVTLSQYNIDVDKPDILVVYHPYDRVSFADGLRSFEGLTFIINTLLIRNEETWDAFWKIQKEGFFRFSPNYYLCDVLLYDGMIRTYREHGLGELIKIGNPKFDGIHNYFIKQKNFEGKWKKLKNKKIILWAPDHGFSDGIFQHTAFEIFVKTIFDYVKHDPKIGLVFRPHKELIRELLKGGCWSCDDIGLLREYCEKSFNILFDESEDYCEAFLYADGIITDAICGITVSALPMDKPICITYRSRYETMYHPELYNAYYHVYEPDELTAFIDMIKEGKDPLYNCRRELISKYIMSFDGKNGWRIKEFIKKKYKESIHFNNI